MGCLGICAHFLKLDNDIYTPSKRIAPRSTLLSVRPSFKKDHKRPPSDY